MILHVKRGVSTNDTLCFLLILKPKTEKRLNRFYFDQTVVCPRALLWVGTTPLPCAPSFLKIGCMMTRKQDK